LKIFKITVYKQVGHLLGEKAISPQPMGRNWREKGRRTFYNGDMEENGEMGRNSQICVFLGAAAL
jgi:hypothetical protein